MGLCTQQSLVISVNLYAFTIQYLSLVDNGQMAHKLKHLIFSDVLYFVNANDDINSTLR